MNGFSMTLVSNSSMDFFPENNTSSFTVQLPEKITLNDTWCVAVAEIHYNYNFFNITHGNNRIVVTKKIENEMNIAINTKTRSLVTIANQNPLKVYDLFITPGYYTTVTDVMDEVNLELQKNSICTGSLIKINKINSRTSV